MLAPESESESESESDPEPEREWEWDPIDSSAAVASALEAP